MSDNGKLSVWEKNRRKAMEQMKDLHLEHGEAAVMRYKGDEDAPVDILSTIYTEYGYDGNREVFSEVFFSDFFDDSTGGTSITALMTLSENIDECPQLSELYVALARVNYYLPIGAFSIDMSGKKLTFKLTFPVAGEADVEMNFQVIDTVIGYGMYMCERFGDYLLALAEGDMSVDEFWEAFLDDTGNPDDIIE